ncbi:hypothetical protein WR25_08969 [Diploscapter pachys]|uniref:Uncharacterized protein n=1 Tax=Diploscapter pachys TaxID=2018661 RepID=A0A2A2LT78_9BILA|nr:hypothetical protein WR25_08969 [Diploscapter pachys]
MEKRNQILDVLIQVNTSDEENKGGIPSSRACELAEFVRENCKNLRLAGFMTIGSIENSEKIPNPDFDVLFKVREEWAAKTGQSADSLELSMGMSGDYLTAMQQGSTSVRVGRKMKISVKKRGTGDLYTFEVNADETFNNFRPLLAEIFGSDDFDVMLGDTNLSAQDNSQTLTQLGLVNGDRLILSSSSGSASVSSSTQSAQSIRSMAGIDSSSQPSSSSARPRSRSASRERQQQRASSTMSSSEFKAAILDAIRKTMQRFNYSEQSLKTGKMENRLVAELGFESDEKSKVPGAMTGCTVVAYIFEPEVRATLTSFVIDKNSQHHMVSTWEVRPDNCIDLVSSGLIRLTLAMRDRINLGLIVGMAPVRDRLVRYLTPKDSTRLAAASLLLRYVITQKDTDQKYWKKMVARDFGPGIHREFVFQKEMTNYMIYSMMANRRHRRRPDEPYVDRRIHARPHIPVDVIPRIPRDISPPEVNPFAPRFPDNPDLEPFRPAAPDPLAPVNPYNPLIDPNFANRRPGGNRNQPGQDPGRADLDPFSDIHGEGPGGMMFPNPRFGGRRPGDPRQMGGGSGGFSFGQHRFF